MPTIVKVVRNATAGTMLAPASTKEPTNGKATKAGMSVMLPATAPAIVDKKAFEFPIADFIVSVGIKVSIRPIKNMIATIDPSMLPIMLFDFFIAAKVFFLFLTRDITVSITAAIKNMSVNISIEDLSFLDIPIL